MSIELDASLHAQPLRDQAEHRLCHEALAATCFAYQDNGARLRNCEADGFDQQSAFLIPYREITNAQYRPHHIASASRRPAIMQASTVANSATQGAAICAGATSI